MDSNIEQSWESMHKEVSGFVNDLEAGLSVITGIDRDYKKILLCGMGASGIGGRLFVDTMYYQSDKVVAVAKTMSLPKWADDETLFVACSYSGNTYETIELYEKAMEAGIDVVVVTHGGRLEELAKENSNKLIKIGGAPIQPRSAIGWFIGLIGGIIEDCGGPGIRYQLRRILPWLRESQTNMEKEDSYTRWIANEIVKTVNNGAKDFTRVPVVYGTPDLDAVVCRIQNQLNENSKLIAFSGVMPEYNHNQIVGWYEDPNNYAFLPIIIRDYYDNDICKLIDSTVEVIRTRGVEPIIVDIKGETMLERMIFAVMFGDYLSYYVAVLRGVNPLNV